MKKTLLITLLGLAIIGCNDQSQQSASPVSSSAQTEQGKHADRVYVGEHNYYVMESAVTNENWVSDDKITPMPGMFPKYYVFNSDEWPKEDINDASSYDLPRFQFAWDNDDDDDDRVKLKIWSMKTDGTDLRLVVPDTNVDGIVLIRRSPNLRYVAWIDRGTGKYVYDLKTGVKTRLIGGGYPGMVWSEDSRYLYFHTMPGQNFDVDREKKQTWQWYALGTGEIGVNSNMSLYNGLANDGLWFKETN